MSTDILALAFEGHPIRTTNETPKRISVLDVLAAVGYADPKREWQRTQELHPELVAKSATYSFGGRGRPTPIIDRQGVLSLVMVLSGPKAATFREWASSVLVRYLDGDRSLAQEIHLRADYLEGEPSEESNEVSRLRSLALLKLEEAVLAKKSWAIKYAMTLKPHPTTTVSAPRAAFIQSRTPFFSPMASSMSLPEGSLRERIAAFLDGLPEPKQFLLAALLDSLGQPRDRTLGIKVGIALSELGYGVVGRSREHGLQRIYGPLLDEDTTKRERAIALLRDPEWKDRSNGDIAKACGCTEGTVRKLKQSLSLEESSGERTIQVTRNGKTYPMRVGGLRRKLTFNGGKS